MFLKKVVDYYVSELALEGKKAFYIALKASVVEQSNELFEKIRTLLQNENDLELIAENIYGIELEKGDGDLDYWHAKFFVLLNDVELTVKLLKAIDEAQKQDKDTILRMGIRKTTKIIYYLQEVLEGKASWKSPVAMSPDYIRDIKEGFAG